MKSTLFSGLLFVCLLLGHTTNLAAQIQDEHANRIRVLSFNILHGATLKGDFDLDYLARVIKEANPDLVALQEVDFRTKRALGMDLVSELGQRTGLIPLFGRAMYFDGGEYGEGILSRYSFLSTRNNPLPAREGKEPRAALEVQVSLPRGDTITFIGTHMDHTRDETDRLAQAEELNKLFAKCESPMVLVGDLNARPESETMKQLFSVWTPSDKDYLPTIPSDQPKAKIDYVLYKPAHRWKVIETRVICDSIATDHCAVLSVLELLPALCEEKH